MYWLLRMPSTSFTRYPSHFFVLFLIFITSVMLDGLSGSAPPYLPALLKFTMSV
jgi:hypothetical protein